MDLDRKIAYLLLGSNLGNSLTLLQDAIALINLRIGTTVAQSSFYRTAAWGKTDQPDFLNVALALETSLTAMELLNEALAIEKDLGRVRFEKWGARLIDIDVIFYADEVINEPGLTIPHPEMQNRKFVLEPLNEVAPTYLHPVLQQTVSQLLLELTDELAVLKADHI